MVDLTSTIPIEAMIPQDHKYRMCTSKKIYRTKKKALLFLQKLKHAISIENNLRPYKCFYCKKWHIGHDKDKKHAPAK